MNDIVCETNPLPLLPSERRAYEMKIREAVNHADAQWNAALRYVNRIVLEADYLTNEQREKLLETMWKK